MNLYDPLMAKMPKKSKSRLTRRMVQHYQSILRQNPCFMFPHPCSYGQPIPRWGIEWAAYHFCKQWRGRGGYDSKKLQRMVINSGNPQVACLFARDVPGASLDKLEKVVVEAGEPHWMREFAKLPGSRKKFLESMAFIADTMNL
jgi:hypothetical protein